MLGFDSAMGWLFLPCFYRLFAVLLPCCFRVVFESFSRFIINRLLMECTKTVDYWQRDREGNREADRGQIGKEWGGNGEGTGREWRGNGEGTGRERGGPGEGMGRERGGNGGFFTKLPYRIRFFLHMSRKSINFAGEFGEICFRFSRLVPINRHVNIGINRFQVLSFKL